jgi:hypothetical protein
MIIPQSIVLTIGSRLQVDQKIGRFSRSVVARAYIPMMSGELLFVSERAGTPM